MYEKNVRTSSLNGLTNRLREVYGRKRELN